MICLDHMGPESAKSFPGQQLVHATPVPAQTGPVERARLEIDDGRRGKGYIFGACRPATGETFTPPSAGRTIANGIDFLERVETWVPQEAETVSAMLDNLNVHRATDVLLFSLAQPRWECVLQPLYAADRNRIEPWWQVLRSLARKGRRVETGDQVCQAMAAATASWNAHRHPFVWGRRRRHRARRQAGIAALPKAA